MTVQVIRMGEGPYEPDKQQADNMKEPGDYSGPRVMTQNHSPLDDHLQVPPLTWTGEFKDPVLERRFRAATWPHTFRILGRTCLFAVLFYGAAGLGPLLEFGFTPGITLLTLARLIVLIPGIWVFFFSRTVDKPTRLKVCLLGFLTAIGLYESIEAVILYTPDLEFTTPFTLLIIFLMYLLLPLLLKPIAVVAAMSSILYVAVLAFMAVPLWTNCIQLAVFFFFANLSGGYIFIHRAKWNRSQFAAIVRIRRLNKRLEKEIREKEKANLALEKLAVTDPLTQVPNRRKFFENAQNEWDRAKRYGHPLSLLMMDLDFFKKINDKFGHHAGDIVLKEVARVFLHSCRSSDFVGRLGGEEFAMMLFEIDAGKAMKVADRIRERIAALDFKSVDPGLRVTVSIGVAQMSCEAESMEACLKRADDALYQAKEEGRNRAMAFG